MKRKKRMQRRAILLCLMLLAVELFSALTVAASQTGMADGTAPVGETEELPETGLPQANEDESSPAAPDAAPEEKDAEAGGEEATEETSKEEPADAEGAVPTATETPTEAPTETPVPKAEATLDAAEALLAEQVTEAAAPTEAPTAAPKAEQKKSAAKTGAATPTPSPTPKAAAQDTGFTPSSYYYLLRVMPRGEERALDIDLASMDDRANAQIYTVNQTPAQLFHIEKVDDSYFKIINAKSGKALDVQGGSRELRANVQQYKWNGTDAQLWKIEKSKNGKGYLITSKLSGLALDVQGGHADVRTNIHLYTVNHNPSQTWYLDAVQCPLSQAVIADIPGQAATGKAVKPTPKVTLGARTLKNGTDYTLSYANNVKAGTATVTVTGKGAYKGTKKATFRLIAAAASLTAGKTYILLSKKNPDLALDCRGGEMTAGTRIWLYTKNDTEAQKIKLVKNSDGSFSLISAKSEMALGALKNSEANGAQLVLQEQANEKGQLFSLRKNSEDGTYTIINKASKKAVDVALGKAEMRNHLQFFTDNQTDAQRFFFVETEAVKVSYTGTYALSSRLKDYMVMDAAGGKTTEGTNIQLYANNVTKAQQFRFKYSGGGTYRIVNAKSGLVVTTKGDSPANNANIELQSWKGQKGQRFKIVSAGGGYVIFRSLLGTAIDIPGGNAARAQSIQTYAFNKAQAQQWKIMNPADVPVFKGTHAADYTTIGEQAYQGNASAKQKIIQAFAAASLDTYRETNFPRSVLIAQAINESGWMSFHETVKENRNLNGTPGMLPKYNNILGMNEYLGSTQWNSPWDGKFIYAAVPQWNAATNSEYLRVETMRTYPDIETCFLDYARFRIAQKKIPIKKGTSPEAVMETYLPGYATNPTYRNDINNIIKKYNLKQYDN